MFLYDHPVSDYCICMSDCRQLLLTSPLTQKSPFRLVRPPQSLRGPTPSLLAVRTSELALEDTNFATACKSLSYFYSTCLLNYDDGYHNCNKLYGAKANEARFVVQVMIRLCLQNSI